MAPDRDTGATNAGQVIVIGGTIGGPDVAVRTVLTQATSGVPGSAASGDRFGASLAIAQLGKGSKADLAIGVPGKKVGGKDGAGSVVVLYSDGSWFGTRGNQQWTQASGGVADSPEAGDGFGGALLARAAWTAAPSPARLGW